MKNIKNTHCIMYISNIYVAMYINCLDKITMVKMDNECTIQILIIILTDILELNSNINKLEPFKFLYIYIYVCIIFPKILFTYSSHN